MVEQIHLPSFNSIVNTARRFYKDCGALPLYEHCHLVIKKAASPSVRIVESKIMIDPNADPERRMMSHVIAETAIFHALKSGYIDMKVKDLPSALREEAVLRNLDIFSGLTQMERSGAPLKEYASLLNNGHAPYALLVKLVDYAVTHKMEDQIEGLVSSQHSPLFRLYSSVVDAQRLLKMDALAGEKIYGPVAELFGYPLLAGDIFEHSFRINHPEIYARVKSLMQDDVIAQRFLSTQVLVNDVSHMMHKVLTDCGFEVDIEVRKQKHDGKKMNKALRIMKKDFDDLRSAKKGTFEDYIKDNISSFDFERFNDWIALRVILKKFRGQDMDELVASASPAIESDAKVGSYDLSTFDTLLKKVRVAELRFALEVVGGIIKNLELTSPTLGKSKCNIVYFEKENGYRGFHADSVSESANPLRPLPYEIQVKTSEWADIATHGKAAHYYYIGGDTEFVDMIKTSYHDIIHRNDNGKKNNSTPPGFCGI